MSITWTLFIFQTYRDFHADLYPETTGFETDLVASEWLNGTNLAVPKINLDPAKRGVSDLYIFESGKRGLVYRLD